MKLACIIISAKFFFGAFDYRESSPAALFTNYNAVQNPDIYDGISNPAYLPLIKNSYLSFSGANPYGLDELYSGNVRGGVSTGFYGFQLAYSNFGIKEYCESSVEAKCGWMPFRFFSAGVEIDYYRVSINTDELSQKTDFLDAGCSLLIRPFHFVDISYCQTNIIAFLKKGKRETVYPESSFGIGVKPVKGLMLAYNYSITAFSPLNKISFFGNVLPYVSLRGGYCRETKSYSSALSFLYKNISVSYGIKYHSFLGYTHSLSATISWNEMKLDQIKYLNPLKEGPETGEIKKININRCTLDELKSVPALSDLNAERLIKYREIIGPVEEDTLYQIGLGKKQIDELLEYIYGLEDKKNESHAKNKKTGNNVKTSSAAVKRILFRRLIEEGMGPGTAFRIAEYRANGDAVKLNAYLDSLKWSDSKKKEAIKKICSGL